MKKEFKYELQNFSLFSDLLRGNDKQHENDSFNSNHVVYHSNLIFSFNSKSARPLSFSFKMKLKLWKEESNTKLVIDVDITKFYVYISVLFLFLSFAIIKLYALIYLNLLWALPFLIIRFRSNMNKEIDAIEQKLVRQIKV
jgi:hypothetical protein